MTLRELRVAHPELFYENQTWFDREAFMDAEIGPAVRPYGAKWPGEVAHPTVPLPSAGQLAAAFVLHHRAPIWERYLWTSDTDAKGQRVYVGGACAANGYRMEIHRHLHLTEQWGTPVCA